jgi:hypothetical protein
MRKRRTVLALILTVALGILAGPAMAADPGVTATEIKIGNTNPYSGPASAYGTIGKVMTAYFKKVNDEGGINGRKINFISLDDGYSPPKTVEMVRRLVEQDQVAFVFQTLGTPSNTAIWKYMNDEKVPSCSWPPARRSGGTRKGTRGPWAGSPITRRKATSTPSTSSRTSPTPSWGSCSRTTTTARTT